MYQKVTFTLPKFIIDRLNNQIPRGKRSEFVAKTIDNQLTRKVLTAKLKKTDPVEEFIKIGMQIKPKKNFTLEETLKLIEKGRA